MPSFSNDDLLAALPMLRRYARLLTVDLVRADAIVEATLTRARQMRNEARQGATPSIGLLSVLRFVYAGQFAPGQPNEAPPLSLGEAARPSGGTGSPERLHGSISQRTKEVLMQLYALPIEQREVLVLVAVERMSYADVATLLDVPVATVLSRLTQARESIRTGRLESLTTPKNAG